MAAMAMIAGGERAVSMVLSKASASAEIITMVVVRSYPMGRWREEEPTKPSSHISVDNCWVRMRRLVMTCESRCAHRPPQAMSSSRRIQGKKAIWAVLGGSPSWCDDAVVV